MFKQIVLGLFIAWLWWAICYFSQAIAEMFWRVDWFERTFSSTRNGYVVVWFLVIVVGFLILFGVIPLSTPIT